MLMGSVHFDGWVSRARAQGFNIGLESESDGDKMSSNQAPLPLQVDIVSDVVCPWCIVGYKQLMKALGITVDQFEVSIRWHPFELNPQMPAEGQNLREHIAQKYGAGAAQSQSARRRFVELGEALGFRFDYYEEMRMVNTFRAHQLLYWAGVQGLQTELAMALFETFFSHRGDVDNMELLVDVACSVGLDPDEARSVLNEARFAGTVREHQAQWRERDIHAVPAFFFQQQYMVQGAQEADTFARILGKIRAKEVK